MATHSSVLAWRIPGMGKPGGLPSMGSHRVGHNWSDLAAAAAYWMQYVKRDLVWTTLCYAANDQSGFSNLSLEYASSRDNRFRCCIYVQCCILLFYSIISFIFNFYQVMIKLLLDNLNKLPYTWYILRPAEKQSSLIRI